MYKKLSVTLFLILLATQCLAKKADEQNVIDVPFQLQNGLVIVDAKIKGNVPVQVVLATGIEHSIAELALLDKYKLSGGYAATGSVQGTASDETYTFTLVSDVSVGGSKSKDLSMRLGSMDRISKMVGHEIFATLGADFFEGQVVQFDFKNKVVRFLNTSVSEKDSKGSKVVLKMDPRADNPFQKAYLLPLVRDVLINGQKSSLMINSGTATPIAISAAMASKFGLTIPPENSQPLEQKLTLRFGSSEFTDVQAQVYPKGPADKTLKNVVAGSLFLQRFISTFDFKKGLIALEPF